MKQSLVFGVCIIFLLLTTTSCSERRSSSDTVETPLSISLKIEPKVVHAFEDAQVVVTVTNQGDSNVLGHNRLHAMPYLVPSTLSELLILISDSHGKPVENGEYRANYQLPSSDTLAILKFGENISTRIYLDGIGFWPSLFEKGEKYTIVAVYQNLIDVTQTIDGTEISSWIGSIRSNEETFVILP